MKFAIPILFLCTAAAAQDSLKVQRFQLNGYVKDLQSLTWQPNMTNLITGNLIHNRINIKWFPATRITGAMELRNRLYWGEEIGIIPAFSSRLRNANEAVDLSNNWIDDHRMVLNTNVDRLWFEYQGAKWNVRLGRQRINWGIGTTWNPNDLYNTFNFLDFDYEERPGADAVKVQYQTGEMDHIEVALALADSSQEIVAAKYFINIAKYDLQFIAGWFRDQPTMGFGWSGSIRETGFKGELQYYFLRAGYRQQLNLSVEADHMFEKGWYISGGFLFNNIGQDESPLLLNVATMDISPRNLMPTKWNSVLTLSKEITPLIVASTTVIYTPGTDLLIVLPTFTFSLTENVDVNIVWQSFFASGITGFDDLSHRAFLRVKWNF